VNLLNELARLRFNKLFQRTVVLLILFLPGIAHAECLIDAARQQIGVTHIYDGSYARIPYPGGDVPLDRGVCTDVLIRAYRKCGSDLQALVHEDMIKAWGAYPKLWGLSRPDSNIDHRRVPNLSVFFARHGRVLETNAEAKLYLPGDIVTWKLRSGVPHIGIVSDRRSDLGVPLVIHNIGLGTQEEDALFLYSLIGHFRFP
jgi:uncharacterized protein YijF (DUF1287 family)